MMRKNFRRLLSYVVILAVFLGISNCSSGKVNAAPPICTWTGAVSSDWSTVGNWDCGRVPVGEDYVVIPETTRDPVYSTGSTVTSITIEEHGALFIEPGATPDAETWTIDGTLYVDTSESSLVAINGDDPSWVVNVSATGSIINQNSGGLIIQSNFNNAGSVYFPLGGFAMQRSGTHTGFFEGLELYLGSGFTGQTIDFNTGSQITATKIYVKTNVNIFGMYNPPTTGSKLMLDYTSTLNYSLTIKPGASVVNMPETTEINNMGKLILETQTYDYSMPKLWLFSGILENQDALTITNQLTWSGGGFAGSGTTTIGRSVMPSIYGSSHTIDGQTLVNTGTVNWNGGNITLSNGANFQNDGIFNANATTTLAGGDMDRFTNNGSFFKKTAATTTTVNIPFTNNGTVEVAAGSLVFLRDIDNGENAVIDLAGGSLDPGDTLTLGSDDSLVGSGTLSANLVNGGTVSPGASPGKITVDGDYTQNEGGTLDIQLGGTTAETGYDQLVVTGTATMEGTLNVSLINDFTPQVGQEFSIITHTTGTGEFDTVNLPTLTGGLSLEIAFSDPEVTLTVVNGGGYTIFLPLILR